jgi:hypothetical protein
MRSPADSMQFVALKLALGRSQKTSFPPFQVPLIFLVHADLTGCVAFSVGLDMVRKQLHRLIIAKILTEGHRICRPRMSLRAVESLRQRQTRRFIFALNPTWENWSPRSDDPNATKPRRLTCFNHGPQRRHTAEWLHWSSMMSRVHHKFTISSRALAMDLYFLQRRESIRQHMSRTSKQQRLL